MQPMIATLQRVRTRVLLAVATVGLIVALLGAALTWGLPALLGGIALADGTVLQVVDTGGSAILELPGLGGVVPFMQPWGLILGAVSILTLALTWLLRPEHSVADQPIH